MVEKVVKTSRAWLLDFGRGLQAAVGAHEMSQVLIAPEYFEIPCTPYYCSEVLIWQHRILPVVDIASLLEGQKVSHPHKNVVGLAVYQTDPNQPIHYGCLHLATTPSSIFVDDSQACELPPQQQQWKPLALSCFSHKGVAVPVLHLAYLFAFGAQQLGYLFPTKTNRIHANRPKLG